MKGTPELRYCLRALAGLRRRLLVAAALEALAMAAALWVVLFALEAALHARLLLPVGVRVVLRPVLACCALASWVGWAVWRLRGRLSRRALAAMVEEADERFQGRLAAAVEAGGEEDAVLSLIAAEAAGLLRESRPSPALGRSALAVRLVLAAALLAPLLLLSAGPARLVVAVADCLFPRREATLGAVFRPGVMLPEEEVQPAGAPVEFTVTYRGWPPRQAYLEAVGEGEKRRLVLEKTAPGRLRGRGEFPPGEWTLRGYFRLRTLAGERPVAGPEKRYRFLRPAGLLAARTRVDCPFLPPGPVELEGLEVLAPPAGPATITLEAGTPLGEVEGEGPAPGFAVKGTRAVARLGEVHPLSFRFRLLPREGLPSPWYTYRLAVERDGPPRLAAFIKDGILEVHAVDDWALSLVRVEAQFPDGGRRSWESPLEGRSASLRLPLDETFPGPAGRYLFTVTLADAARPRPNRSLSPVLAYERKPSHRNDPLLGELPRRPQRFLARRPPAGSPPAASPAPRPPAPRRRPGPQSLASSPQQPPEAGSRQTPGQDTDRPRYAAPPTSSPGKGSQPPKKDVPPPTSGRPPSTPEGGLAGRGDKGTAGRPAAGKAPPGKVGTPGAGPPAPVDAGPKTGYETGPTPAFPEKVDEERVADLDIPEAELAGTTARHPFAGRGKPPAEEVARRPGKVRLEAGKKAEERFDPSILPARYRALLERLASGEGR